MKKTKFEGEQERQTNLIALRRMKTSLHKYHLRKWVVIENGDLKHVSPSIEELRKYLRQHPLQSTHAFVFEVSKERKKRTWTAGWRR